MKIDAGNWDFLLHEPDIEDLKAKMKSRAAYCQTIINEGGELHPIDCYDAGFYRGYQWAIAKLRLEIK